MFNQENILQKAKRMPLYEGKRNRVLDGAIFFNAPNCSANPPQLCRIPAKT
jgi:hypothetical protein